MEYGFSSKIFIHTLPNILNPLKITGSESLKTYKRMKSQTEKTAVELIDYLPELKQKFINAVGTTNQMEQILINAAFENYELYLAFRANNNIISAESTERMKKSGESDHLQLASMALYYDKLTEHFKQGNFIEVDTNLLREIFKFYRESMLHFKFQKLAFNTIKTSLSNIINL